jgi:hypothetical protein
MRVLRLVYFLMLFVDPQYGQGGFEETSTLQIHLSGKKLFSARASFEVFGAMKLSFDLMDLMKLLTFRLMNSMLNPFICYAVLRARCSLA